MTWLNKMMRIDCIVHSPTKYRETEGIKDIGTNFWNEGRTQEIRDRVVHMSVHNINNKES